MKQETNDNIIKVTSEWEQYEIRCNWDCTATDLLRHFCDIMHGMTYGIPTIIDALKEVAEGLEEEIRVYNKYNEEEEEDGTTN